MRVMERPRPVPDSFVVKKGWKIFPILSAGIPGPSSATVAITKRLRILTSGTSGGISECVRTVRLHPSGLAWSALSTRFRKTCLICSWSASISGMPGSNSRPIVARFPSGICFTRKSTLSITSFRLTIENCGSVYREKFRRSRIVWSRRFMSAIISSRISRLGSPSGNSPERTWAAP